MSSWKWHERYSFAWLRAMAAASKFDVAEHEVDQGVDATLTREEPHAMLRVQLKTVTHDADLDQHGWMGYSLSGKRIHKLTASPYIHGMLIVIRLPRHPEDWMDDQRELVMGTRSWWQIVEDAVDLATIPVDDSTHTIKIPPWQRLTADALTMHAERRKA